MTDRSTVLGSKFGGIRTRVTVGATAVVAIALAVASVGLLWTLDRNLDRQRDDAIATQALDRAALIDGGADPGSLVATRARESFVWIGLPSGELIVNGGLQLTEVPDIDPTFEAGGAEVGAVEVSTVEATFIEDSGSPETENLRVAAAAATSNGSIVLILVGAEDHTAGSTLQSTTRTLLLIAPLLVLAAAVATWIAIGRAMDPVEQIRAEAAEISATGDGLARRVPESGSGDEIDRLAITVNDMLARLAEHEAKSRQFAADASHELKTPTANLRALLELATEDSWEQARDGAIDEADRLVHIVDDLLYMNSKAAGPGNSRGPVHLDDIVFDEVELVSKRVSPRIDVGRVGPADVTGDSLALRRVIRNLLDNATRYAADLVEVELSATDSVRLVVSDDGPGIAVEHRALVLERFGRVDDSRSRRDGGTGLGLSIVDDIVANHGGYIAIDDAEIGGARITVRLPRQSGQSKSG